MQDPQIWGVRNIKHLGFSYELEGRRPVHLMMSDLRWNFNIENKLGWDGINIAYRGIQPLSCLRLQEKTNFYMMG
jgi:hypothetical protein